MSKGGGKSQTVTQTTQLPPWVDQAAQANLAEAERIAAERAGPSGVPLVSGLTPDQLAAYGMVRDNAGALSPARFGLTLSRYMNPYIQGVIDPAVSAAQREGNRQRQMISAQAANVGAFGGARQGVLEGVNAAETTRNIGELTAQLRAAGYESAANRAFQGIGATMQGAGALEAAGAAQQGQAERQLADIERIYEAFRNDPVEALQLRMAALTGTPYGGTGTSSQPLTRSPVAGALGGAATGAGIASALSLAGPWGPILAGAGGLLGLIGG